MATKNDSKNLLTESFIEELFATCSDNEHILSVVCNNVEESHMPDKNSALILRALKEFFRQYKRIPTKALIEEKLQGQRAAINFWVKAYDSGNMLNPDECLGAIEEYIKRVEFQQAVKKATEVFNREGYDGANDVMFRYTDWARTFSLTGATYTDIIGSFSTRLHNNRQKSNSKDRKRAITRFYIDDLDICNQDRDLRTQLTCILAPTGVGKSHAIRWIGSQACLDGLNVLHFQLEGSQEEIENAYSAALVACNVFSYEKGFIKDADIDRYEEELKGVSGKLYVRCYPKFNQRVSTLNIKEGISEFRKTYNLNPDVVLIDSMDLLNDSSGRKYTDTGERHKRIAVANDLKDLAADEDVWIAVSYQARIENPDWVNDEKNVLTEYSSAEAKGIAQPLTHLITLNQSASERKEKTMRIHVAKSRFFAKGDTFKIATDYDREQFFDRARTANL